MVRRLREDSLQRPMGARAFCAEIARYNGGLIVQDSDGAGSKPGNNRPAIPGAYFRPHNR